MTAKRRCSKTGCQRSALATLTYNYADSTVVVGPLSRRAEPHTYDLCREHAESLTAPKGWEILRLELPERYEEVVGPDDLLAVVEAVGRPPAAAPAEPAPQPGAAAARTGQPRPTLGGPDGPARPPKHGLRVIRGSETND